MQVLQNYKNKIKNLLLKNNNCAVLFNVFYKENFTIKCVGGCVRDALLDKKSDDIDFATNAIPEQIQNILIKNNIHYFNSGLKHGTITAVFNKTSYEITTLRSDTKCDGRHAIVEFTDDWKLDASRRDFTFNALYADQDGNIYDYFNGINDLLNGVLKFIGDPLSRIQEDYLRILRAFRFYNRYCDKPMDGNTLEIIKSQAFNIEKLSGERIQSEIIKLLSDYIPNKTIDVLNQIHSLGLSKYIFLKDSVDFAYLLFCENLDAWEKLGILSRYNKIDISLLNNRWHISNTNYSVIKSIYNIEINSDILIKRKKYFYIYKDMYEVFLICCLIEEVIDKNQLYELLLEFGSTPVSEFPINATILMERGFQGAEIGKKLKICMKVWLDSDCTMEINEILNENTKKR